MQRITTWLLSKRTDNEDLFLFITLNSWVLLVAKYELGWLQCKAISRHKNLPNQICYIYFLKSSKLPRNSSRTRVRNLVKATDSKQDANCFQYTSPSHIARQKFPNIMQSHFARKFIESSHHHKSNYLHHIRWTLSNSLQVYKPWGNLRGSWVYFTCTWSDQLTDCTNNWGF